MRQASIILFIGIWLLSLTAALMTAHARILTDQAGRSVEVPVAPQRVVSLAPSITEIIYDIDCENLLIGATTYSNHPDAARALPRVGSYVNLDIEKIVALKPDLCIGIKDGNPKEVVMRLEALGIPVYAVDPKNLESIRTTVVEIGDLLQASHAAYRVSAEMESRMDHLRRLVDTADHRPLVFFQIGISPIVSAGSDTFIHELIKVAGGINLAQSYTSYPRFSTEEVIVAEPEIIIITSMARNKVFEEVKAAWRQWSNIPAVKNNRIFLVDSDLFDRPTPRLIDGLEILVTLFHPELTVNEGETP